MATMKIPLGDLNRQSEHMKSSTSTCSLLFKNILVQERAQQVQYDTAVQHSTEQNTAVTE